MARKRDSAEEIIGKLREAEVLRAQGRSIAEAARAIGVTKQSYYRWRREYGGLKTDQARRLKELEWENVRLPKAVAGGADHPTTRESRPPSRHRTSPGKAGHLRAPDLC